MLGTHFFDAATRMRLESEILPAYLPRCRWYRSKSGTIARVNIESSLPVGRNSVFCVLKVVMEDGSDACYALPVTWYALDADIPESAVVDRTPTDTDGRILGDACYDSVFRDALFEIVSGQTKPLVSRALDSRVLSGEQSNTSIFYGSEFFLKLYRRLDAGTHPEPEILRFLHDETNFEGIPEFIAEWQVPGSDAKPATAALLQRFVKSEGNAWDILLEKISSLFSTGTAPIPESLLDFARRLGISIGELHKALGSSPQHDYFAPEPLTATDLDPFFASAGETLTQNLAAMGLTSTLSNLLDLLRDKGEHDLGQKIRIHGDLHLGQILCGSDGFWFLDFEGEPLRSLEERRRKHSPLRDVAGMLRSFHYALHVSARQALANTERLESWHGELSAVFLNGYESVMGETGLLPSSAIGRTRLLRRFVLEKAIYELSYERNNRPDWVDIPLRGLQALSAAADSSRLGMPPIAPPS